MAIIQELIGILPALPHHQADAVHIPPNRRAVFSQLQHNPVAIQQTALQRSVGTLGNPQSFPIVDVLHLHSGHGGGDQLVSGIVGVFLHIGAIDGGQQEVACIVPGIVPGQYLLGQIFSFQYTKKRIEEFFEPIERLAIITSHKLCCSLKDMNIFDFNSINCFSIC